MKKISIFIFLLLNTVNLFGQNDRFEEIEQRLKDLSQTTPSLKDKADLSVSGASIQEFLRGLAESHNLNINVDPSLNFKIYNNFNNEKVINIILFVIREYNLDIRFVGSIMSFYKYEQTPLTPPAKQIDIKFNTYNELLSLSLVNDSLESVVKLITQMTKRNVILSSDLPKGRLLNVYIENMPFDNAIEKMAFANDLKVTKTSDNFYLIQPFADAEEKALIATSKKKVNRVKFTSTEGSSNLFVESIVDSIGIKRITMEAKNAPLTDILRVLSEEISLSYFLYSDIKGIVSLNVNNLQIGELLTYLFKGTEYTYKVDKNIYLIGDRKLEGLREYKVLQFQNRSLDTIINIIPSEIKRGVEIKEFKELNSILLSGGLPQINEIEAFVKVLDKVVPMVMIEVIIVDIRKGKTITTGIRAGLSDTVSSGGSILPGVNFNFSSNSINNFLSILGSKGSVNLGRVTPNFYVGLSALENNNNIDIRSMPKLSTLNGHPANLSIGKTAYYSNSTQNVLGSLQPQTVVTQQWNKVEANMEIKIRPIVSGDDQVTLNIDVEISDFIEDKARAITVPPASTNNEFKSIVRVKNDEMIVLGGLERNEKSESGQGFPLLGRIPVIKWLFSSRTRTRNKAITLIFIKPTIIY